MIEINEFEDGSKEYRLGKWQDVKIAKTSQGAYFIFSKGLQSATFELEDLKEAFKAIKEDDPELFEKLINV